jgi:hypothetical protein
MRFRTNLNRHKTKLYKIKVPAKVRKIQIKILCGYSLKGNKKNAETNNWVIWEVIS